ncbi:hypothetical protein [Klebsiella pneumoniae]|uniref:hypothetical protein n=1 Tax=Klebsiella pneumoniae TaxID=573 RepID=UPI003754FE35
MRRTEHSGKIYAAVILLRYREQIYEPLRRPVSGVKMSKKNEQKISGADPVNKHISCQIKLSPIADNKLISVQTMLKKNKAKITKARLINMLIENLNVDEIYDIARIHIEDELKQELTQKYQNTEMEEHDMEIIRQMIKNNFS